MKRLFTFHLLPLCVALMAMSAAAASIPEKRINGTTYYSMPDWVEARQLGFGWVKRNDVFQITNQSARIRLNLNSREAEVNGVTVWLLFPFVKHKGGLYIAKLDAESTLQPLLFPPRNLPRDKVKTICLDPGHGGRDPGNHVGSHQEKDYTLLLAYELRDQLRKAGFTVVLTRGSDDFGDLASRPTVAKRTKADLFVSLHFNATPVGRGTVRGVETYALTPAGARSTAAAGQGDTGGWTAGNRNNDANLLLACRIQQQLVKRLPTVDRGVRRARYWVLREAAMPAVLVEGGFMSHPTEGRKIFTAAYRQQMARAIKDGIVDYKRVVERPR